ncbi:tetratricopeptide repeat protein [bacterium]|nr:tetratricopeptide repeat protein [bacterium]
MAEHDYKFYLNAGIDKTNQGKFDEALELLEKALGLNDKNALIHFSKAIVYHNLHQLRAAYENYSHAIELDEKMIDAYYNRAQTILAFEKPTENELKEALDDLIKATELDDKFIDAYYYAATIKKKFEDYEGAIELLNKVLELEPQAPYSRALKKLIEQKYLGR